MSKLQRKELFIKMTEFLYHKGQLFYSEQAERLEKEYPRLGKNRMKNLRASKTKVYPKVYEIEALKKVFESELLGFKSEIGEPSEIEKQLRQLQNDVAEIKEYLKNRDQLLAEISRINREHKERKK